MTGHAPDAPRLPYVPSLDGLRAVAVSAVFLFHAGVLRGGFIGVDVFFVISGFLITSLALSEIDRTGRLALGAFWARRARRLLPALFAVMGAVVVYSLWAGDAALRRVGDDVLSTTFYVTNWAQIGEGRDYFAQYESEPLLEHAWSLSVEEQFYVVWPILIVGLVMLTRRFDLSARRVVTVSAGVAAAASVAAAFWLKSLDGTSLSRLYYGTDTRAVGLAVGAAFGAALRPDVFARWSTPRAARDAVGVAALLGLGWISLTVDGTQDWLYGPGFLVIALLSVTLIAVSLGAGRLADLLAKGPAVVLGRVSYGVYLWHWPVIVVLDSERSGLSGPALGALWVAATAAMTAISWFVVEQRAPLPTRGRPWRVALYGGVAVMLCVSAVVVAENAIARERDAAYTIPVVSPVTTVSESPSDIALPAPADSVSSSSVPASTVPPSTVPPSTVPPSTVPADRPLRLLILGDSVAMSLRDGPEPLPEQGRYAVPGYGDVEIRNLGVIGCSVVEEGAWLFEGDTLFAQPPLCAGEDRFAADVDEFQPDVVLTLFGWPGLGDRRFDDGATLTACAPRFDESWRRDYQQLIDRLGGDHNLVVANIAPVLGADEAALAGTRCLNALVAGLDARVVDYQGWLCPDYDCTVSASLRPDGLHFRSTGRLQVDVTVALTDLVLQAAGY